MNSQEESDRNVRFVKGFNVRIRQITDSDTAEIELIVLVNCLPMFLEVMHYNNYHVEVTGNCRISFPDPRGRCYQEPKSPR